MFPYEFGVFRVGDCIPPLAIQSNGCMAVFNCGALHINTLIYRPDTLLRHKADVDRYGIRLGLYTYHNVMLLAVKPGDLPWHTAPYTPHLSQPDHLPPNSPIVDGEGLVAYHFLIDSCDGRILQIKPFVLANRFSNSLIGAIYALKQDSFHPAEYVATVNNIQQRYSPRELGTSLSQDRFRLSPTEDHTI